MPLFIALTNTKQTAPFGKTVFIKNVGQEMFLAGVCKFILVHVLDLIVAFSKLLSFDNLVKLIEILYGHVVICVFLFLGEFEFYK